MSLPLSIALRRRAQRYLSQSPLLYLGMLRWTGLGSLEKKIYLTLIHRNDVVFDIGANYGHFTLLFSDLSGPGGEVHAFEPLPPTFACLRETMAQQQQFDNILFNNVACAEHACDITLHVPGDDAGQASLKPQCEGSWRNVSAIAQLPVKAIRLDEYERGRCADRIDFVKCDIEGAELLAMRGMTKQLMRHHPILFLEAFSAWTKPFGYSPEQLPAYLETIGYDAFYLVTDHIHLMLDPCPTLAAAAANESVNLLCAQSDQHRNRLRDFRGLAC